MVLRDYLESGLLVWLVTISHSQNDFLTGDGRYVGFYSTYLQDSCLGNSSCQKESRTQKKLENVPVERRV